MNRCILLSLICLTEIKLTDAQSHFCPKPYQVTLSRVETTYIACGAWASERCPKYRIAYYAQTFTDETNCCANFKGENCDIPICDPPCLSPAPCIVGSDQNICYCGDSAQGEACNLAACSTDNNCFPGTCLTDGDDVNCACSPGYGGENCTNILTAGKLKSCEISFTKISGEDLGTFDCLEDSDQIVYTNANDADYMHLEYRVGFQGLDTPPFPSYIVDFDIGLVGSAYDIVIVDPDNTRTANSYPCIPELEEGAELPSQDKPYQTLWCNSGPITVDKGLIKQQGHLSFVMQAISGGFKAYKDDQSQLVTNYYSGTESTFVRNITYDLKSPSYCLDKAEGSCKVEPLASYSDLTTVPEVHTEWFEWADADSGIASYEFCVYRMSKGADDRLTEIKLTDPLFSISLGPEDYFHDYTFENPGMYSIRLEVCDLAGNKHLARSLILFDQSSDITVDEDKKVTVENTITVEGRRWFRGPENDDLVIHWEGRFSNQALYSNNWLIAVKDASSELIDDTTGNRTVDAIDNVRGIVMFTIAYIISDYNDLPNNPDNLQANQLNLQEIFTLSGEKEDGKAVRFFITATDALGNERVEIETIHFDSSPPIFNDTDSKIAFNDGTDNFPYSTRVDLSVQDPQSGLKNIDFHVLDTTILPVRHIYTGSSIPEHLRESCLSACYCLKYDSDHCFSSVQSVWIDHCQLTELAGHSLQLEFTVTNGADITKTFIKEIGVLESPTGIREYQPPSSISVEGFYPKVTIRWSITPSCYDLSSIKITIVTDETTFVQQVLPDAKTYMHDTQPATNYHTFLTFEYVGNIEVKSHLIKFQTAGDDEHLLPTTGEPQTTMDDAGSNAAEDFQKQLGPFVVVVPLIISVWVKRMLTP